VSTWHALKTYIKYRKQAKTRHGVHSPFVFDFVENVLHNKAHIPGEDLPERIATYYKINPVYLSLDQPDVLHSFEQCLPTLRPEDIIIIRDIHTTAHNSKVWKRLASHTNVTMSIDLYKIGLLLFRKEFKVKQHFILK